MSTPGSEASRRWIVPVLIVLASLIGFLSVFALWVKRQALETDTWTETSSEIEQLERLVRLRDSEVLSADEFAAEKRRIVEPV